jgi:hypothetical protein
MSRKDPVQNHKPKIGKEAAQWLAREIKAQEQRHAAIVAEQEALTPERERWYAEFLEIVQTRGFNVTGDQRRVIEPHEVPERPDREDAMRVVW